MSTDINMITPAQERLLASALVSAIRDVNNGTGYNEALAKSANAHGLTPEFACRMVEAYNASKTVKHLQSTTGEKRADSFDLADRDTVLKLMYGTTESAPVAEKTAGAVYSVLGVVKKPAPSLEKAAEQKAKPAPKALWETRYTKLASLREQLKRAGDELRMELRHCQDQAVKSACALESALRTPGHVPFSELEQRVVGTYGEMGKRAMNIVWGMCDFERFGEKRASETPARRMVMGVGPVYDAARELMSWLDKAAKVTQQMHDYETEAKKAKSTMTPEQSGQHPGGTGATFVSDPGMPRRPATAPLVDVDQEIEDGDKKKDEPEKTAATVLQKLLAAAVAVPVGTDVATRVMIPTGKKPAEAAEKAAGDEGPKLGYDPAGIASMITKRPEEGATPFADPQHEAKIRAIRAKLVVNDMISNDPVLSAYPPENVFNTYNELSRLAPGVSGEPLLMRSLVGRALQTGGRLEANEVKQLLEAESTHRNIRTKGY